MPQSITAAHLDAVRGLIAEKEQQLKKYLDPNHRAEEWAIATVRMQLEMLGRVADLFRQPREDFPSRLPYLRALLRMQEVCVANGAEERHHEDGTVMEDWVTCGTCGEKWNDALISGRTPAPAARCPYEHVHQEMAELRALENIPKGGIYGK